MADDDVRKLRWQLKQAHATLGKQGDTIHQLRSELAEVRSLNSKLERGELRRLESNARAREEDIASLTQQVGELTAMLTEQPINA